MFSFLPADWAEAFARQDYVHIPGGLAADYFEVLKRQVAESLESRRLERFALGNKQQALYDFPSADHYRSFLDMVGAITGLHPERIVISERHIKAYEPDAAPYPSPHKDRFATQLAIGFTVANPHRSRLVLYPRTDRGVNPYNSWAQLRERLPDSRSSRQLLADAPRVEIVDEPGDVIVFRGNSIWHARERAAETVMLYFKLNAFNCDPLGEDPFTADVAEETKCRSSLPRHRIANLIPVLGRRIDSIRVRINHERQEAFEAVWGDGRAILLDSQQWRLLRELDGSKRVGDLFPMFGAEVVSTLRQLAEIGVIDLLAPVSADSPRTRAVALPG